MEYWHGYLSGARCRLAYGPAGATVSCSSKIQIGFTFLVPAHPGSPGQRAVKWVCVTDTITLLVGLLLAATPTATHSRDRRRSETGTDERVSSRDDAPAQGNLAGQVYQWTLPQATAVPEEELCTAAENRAAIPVHTL